MAQANFRRVGGYERAQRRASEGRISRGAVGGTSRLAYSGAAQAQGIYFSPPGLDLNREPEQRTERQGPQGTRGVVERGGKENHAPRYLDTDVLNSPARAAGAGGFLFIVPVKHCPTHGAGARGCSPKRKGLLALSCLRVPVVHISTCDSHGGTSHPPREP